jgi:hypothetical protein
MPKKAVFISYDHSEDAHYKNLLKAWDANDNFEFEFDQRSPDEPIDSTNAAIIKQGLTKMTQNAEYLLVIVGNKSHQSKWMKWEISRAKQSDLKLKLAAIKLDNSYTTPSELMNSNTSFAKSFTRDSILAALNSATNIY